MSDYTPVEVLAAHPVHYRTPSGGRVWCGCGLAFDARSTHAAHVLDALTKAGHVVVTLPKAGRSPVEELDEGDDPRQWLGPTERYFIEEGSVASEGGFHWTPSGARQEAAALLAAAAAAEPTAKGATDE